MDRAAQAIIELAGSAVFGSDVGISQQELSDSLLVEMFLKADKHNIAHIVGNVLAENKLLEGKNTASQFTNNIYTAVYKSEKFSYVLSQVSAVLEENKIPYIPLKGSVLCKLYPQEWMRTGCDIDILVKKRELNKAFEAVLSIPGYKLKEKTGHDVSVVSSENVCVELHFSLIEESKAYASARVLKKVWKHAKSASDGIYRYELDKPMFYFYHIAHMAKHFAGGGCGVRPFIDLWLMENFPSYRTAETEKLLKKGGLVAFADAAVNLSAVWFGNRSHDETTLLMQDYIFKGGIFGSFGTRTAVDNRTKESRIKSLLSKIFVPLNDMKRWYPALRKYPFLFLIYEVYRWQQLLFGEKKRFRESYVENMKNMSEEDIENIKTLFEKTGL